MVATPVPAPPAADRAGSAQMLRMLRVLQVLDALGDIGARPSDTKDERLRHGSLILASLLIVLLSFVWVVTYLFYGHPVAAAIPGTYQVLTVAGLLVLARTRRFAVFRTTQFLAFLVLPGLLQISLGGFVASSGMVLWVAFTPLAALAMLGVRRALAWLTACFVWLVLLAILDSGLAAHPAQLPDAFVVTFFVLNVMGVTVSAFVMLGYFVEQRERARAALELERERSERLLLNVLPSAIARRLKEKDDVIAEHYDDVSVLFADLADFTEHAMVLPAVELVALLDRIFTAFDEVADAYDVEKIKTIGDAYMVAGGLPEPRPDHLQAIALTALAMREELERVAHETGHSWLAVRIGIDSGPAVAGVIGRRKFIYDLWGDTVNTASRMESHGLTGEIQVTERVAAALREQFVIRPRGTVAVKGKGLMQTFLLTGQLPEAATAEMPAVRPESTNTEVT
ncbi:MAG TPA: adenylate/guanylate cyclase domain-containing protein [Intrasporangium sp.]|uniref:adenylate/guanylate cyclase domain-containing protein n=1 Tax=Intrasporangium sp. TaxID=1925024 RepID=UPI002F950016